MSTYESVPSTPPQPACPACHGERFHPGFIEDAGEASQGYARWIPGTLERGIFGGARRFGKQRFMVEADRCERCGYLMMFARTAV